MYSPRLAPLLMIVLFLLPVHSRAQPDNGASPDATEKTADTEKADQSANRTVKQKTDTTTFTPSEKIRADEAVSFPVDI